jgi:hypothetical protein
MIIRTVLRRGIDHPLRCEDDLFVIQKSNFIIGAIFDGCTTGETSSFASSLFVKIFKKSIDEIYCNYIIKNSISFHMQLFYQFIFNLKNISLGLKNNELWSTIVYFVYDIEQKKLVVSICGDGNIYCDGINYRIHNEDNSVLYLIDELKNSIKHIYDNLFLIELESPHDFAIASDGIETYKTKLGINSYKQAFNYLILDGFLKQNEAMLARKCNILEKKHNLYHTDDLSIIRVMI